MNSRLIDRLAFAMQDETMTRLQARRYVRQTLAAIEHGDVLGDGLIAVRRQGSGRATTIDSASAYQIDMSSVGSPLVGA